MTVLGNAEGATAANVVRLREIADRSDMLVAAGAATFMTGSSCDPIPDIHGDDGQDNTHLPPPRTVIRDKAAAELLNPLMQ